MQGNVMLAVLTICAMGWGSAPCKDRSDPMPMAHCLNIMAAAQASGGWLLFCRPVRRED